jgi:hypothetical protein
MIIFKENDANRCWQTGSKSQISWRPHEAGNVDKIEIFRDDRASRRRQI